MVLPTTVTKAENTSVLLEIVCYKERQKVIRHKNMTQFFKNRRI